MVFVETKLKGVYIIEPEPIDDERGFFARTFCQDEFSVHGLNPRVVQCSISFNKKKGTLRGLHYQLPPRTEAKLVRCTRGAIFDVAVDVRAASPTFKQWVGMELTAENRRMSYLPEGTAHGFQTLVDGAEVTYHISESYDASLARGLRWDDPAIGINWPAVETRTISAKDLNYPDFSEFMVKW